MGVADNFSPFASVATTSFELGAKMPVMIFRRIAS
jgi:hypothetical protein